MPRYEYTCEKCGHEFEEQVPMSECGDKQDCPVCERNSGVRAYRTAPLTRTGGEGSDRDISAMQKSFRERFVKKELDDVRHKHGKAIDDSLAQTGVARKIKGKK